jgi:hypothetical protein
MEAQNRYFFAILKRKNENKVAVMVAIIGCLAEFN